MCEIGYVSLLRSEENLLELPFYKHYVPTGRGSCLEKTLSRKQEVDGLLHRGRRGCAEKNQTTPLILKFHQLKTDGCVANVLGPVRYRITIDNVACSELCFRDSAV